MTQLDFPLGNGHRPTSWSATRDAALRQLNTFAPRAGEKYARTRNHDRGPGNRLNVSTLSPWIRHRVLLEEDVLTHVFARQSPQTAEKFIQEIVWRGYFKGWLEHRPFVWHQYKDELNRLTDGLGADRKLMKRFATATSGQTGIACFDAWSHELIETGYLHNHARMWFASIWIYTLGLPWQLGADFFYRHLLDGDPASNTLSWRWVGGLHTRGKTYLARPDNIARYTDGRFPLERGLAKTAPPLEEPPPGAPMPVRPADQIAEPVRCVLLVSEEDCHPESWAVHPAEPVAVVGLALTANRSPMSVSPTVRAFAEAAVSGAVTRAAEWYECPDNGVLPSQDWAEALAALAKRAGADTIVTAYTPAGPVQDAMTAADADLGRQGIRMRQLRRRYDDLVWPHATAGFFKVKAKIPDILRGLGVLAGTT